MKPSELFTPEEIDGIFDAMSFEINENNDPSLNQMALRGINSLRLLARISGVADGAAMMRTVSKGLASSLTPMQRQLGIGETWAISEMLRLVSEAIEHVAKVMAEKAAGEAAAFQEEVSK